MCPPLPGTVQNFNKICKQKLPTPSKIPSTLLFILSQAFNLAGFTTLQRSRPTVDTVEIRIEKRGQGKCENFF
jgi:hypothetical protein